MATNIPISVAHGDGIGPKIMDATLQGLKEAGVHMGQEETAERVRNGWFRAIEDGIHAYDICALGQGQ